MSNSNYMTLGELQIKLSNWLADHPDDRNMLVQESCVAQTYSVEKDTVPGAVLFHIRESMVNEYGRDGTLMLNPAWASDYLM